MTAVSWVARGRQVVGLSGAQGGDGTVTVFWGPDPEVPSLPWAVPRYPCLLVLTVSFVLNCVANVAARRPRLRLRSPVSGILTEWVATQTTTSGQSRTYVFAAGVTLDGTTAGQSFRESLPESLILQPGSASGGSGELTVSIDNFVFGDNFLVAVHGVLLPS